MPWSLLLFILALLLNIWFGRAKDNNLVSAFFVVCVYVIALGGDAAHNLGSMMVLCAIGYGIIYLLARTFPLKQITRMWRVRA